MLMMIMMMMIVLEEISPRMTTSQGRMKLQERKDVEICLAFSSSSPQPPPSTIHQCCCCCVCSFILLMFSIMLPSVAYIPSRSSSSSTTISSTHPLVYPVTSSTVLWGWSVLVDIIYSESCVYFRAKCSSL